MNLTKTASLLLLFFFTLTSYSQSKTILVFSKTEGYRHQSIVNGVEAIKKLGKENDFDVVHSENARLFTDDSLRQFNMVLFLNTTGNIFNELQQQAFKRFINNGGGFVGVHSATDTEYDWPWYNKLVGAYFKSHPEEQKASIKVTGHKHPATKHLPNPWQRFDEWYNFKNISMSITVLATLDENSYSGGENGLYHPIAWCQKFDGGKMFYTALGHTKQSYTEDYFLKHLLGGIQYVLND